MKCVVPGANVKILARAIHALAKIGDEMYVQPQQKCLSFRTVNMANSAYADFTFVEAFFSYYIFGNLAEEDALKCKISIRSAMTVFKAINAIDKQVETCHIQLEADASVLIFTLKYKNSIKKVHLLPILDCEKLQAAYAKDGSPNQLSSQSQVFSDAVQNFQQNLVEITMQVMFNKVLLRNYIDDVSSVANKTRTQLALGSGEFDRFIVSTEAIITFCMKELRAILNFADVTGLPINVYFECAGRPIVFVVKNMCFEANLVLSTLNPDVESQSDITIPVKQGRAVQKKSTARRKCNRVSPKSLSTATYQSDKTVQSFKHSVSDTSHLLLTRGRERTSVNVSEHILDSNRDNNTHILNVSSCLVKTSNVNTEKNESRGTLGETSTHSDRKENVGSNETSTCRKRIVKSVFSSIIKPKSTDISSEEEYKLDQDVQWNENVSVCSSQPAKKAKIIFKKCFEATFDPRMLPGHDTILVEDSDGGSE